MLWKVLYKPGGITIITQQLLCHGITYSGQDLHRLGRWSYITITSRVTSIITIISAYYICEIFIKNADPTTNAMQQWQILEERDQEHEDNRHKIIIDLFSFINSLTRKIKKSYWVSMQINLVYFIITASKTSSNAPNYLTQSMKILTCTK